MPSASLTVIRAVSCGGFTHGISHIAFGPDGLLYLSSGSRTDGGEKSTNHPDSPAGETDLTAAIWFGLNASRNTPRPIADQLQRVVAKSVSSNEFRERLLRDDVEPIGSTPDQYGAFVSAELAKWSKVIINANIKAE